MALQFTQDPWPVDVALPWRKVVIAVASVVIDMDHVQVAGKLVNDAGEFSRQMGMSRIETRTDVAIANGAEQIHHVVDVAEK